jgi:signal transduction histidine kinase
MVLHRGQAAEAFWTRNLFTVGKGYIGLVAKARIPVVSKDLKNDERFLRDAVVKAGFHQMVGIPLLSVDNLIGVMSVATQRTDPLDEQSVQMMAAVGNWAGLAIENARLHASARRVAVLGERDRIGMDLHDGIIQSIYGVGLSLESALHSIEDDPNDAKKRVQYSIDGLNQAIRDLRSYILDLRPRQLGSEGLINGIKRLIAEYRANTFAEVRLTEPDSDLKELSQAQALTLFHICQEALANAAKHAKAKNVQVALWTTDDRVLMEINDDGNGFDMEQLNVSIGHGLANMQTRAHSVGGEVDISSVLNEGSTILVWVPRHNKS